MSTIAPSFDAFTIPLGGAGLDPWPVTTRSSRTRR